MIGDNPVTEKQPHPRAVAFRLRRKEGIEDSAQRFFRNTGPRIADRHRRPLSIQVRHSLGPDGDETGLRPFLGRIERIVDQVEQDRLEPIPVSHDRRQIRRQDGRLSFQYSVSRR